MITIVDYGMGNLASVQNMLKRVGHSARISSNAEEIATADKLILPGVGAFDQAMQQIENRGLRAVLDRKALEERIPILGICLGMQLLTRSSEEGTLPGLGWVPAVAKRFPARPGLKVPHMGWNVVETANDNPLAEGHAGEEVRFYFVHSYFVAVDDEAHSIFKAHHGVRFDAGVRTDNIMGVQFHPEKSHRFGMRLFSNFAKI